MQNNEVATILFKIADHLEINGHNPYRVKAYRRAARSVSRMSSPLSELIKNDFDLTSIPYVGKSIAAHIKVILKTGTIPFFLIQQSLPKKYRNELRDIEGLGIKRLQILNDLKIYTKDDLLAAIQSGQLRNQKGFNTKLEQKILNSIANPKPYHKIFKYRLVALIVESLAIHLQQLPEVRQVECCSDYRRKKELCGNTIIVFTSKNPQVVIEQFVQFDEVREIVKVESVRAIVILQSGLQITLAWVDEKNVGTKLVLATGAPKHIAELEEIAQQKEYQLNDDGLWQHKRLLMVETEEDFYQRLNLQYIPPELREGRGELRASEHHRLPNLITLADIKGDLHSHTNETDGTETLETMVAAAQAKGYEYLAITDHSQSLTITNGLDERRLMKQIERINLLNSKLKNFTILKGIEVDILADGSLDLPDSILSELDIRVCSIHSRFNFSLQQQTERILRAMDNPYFNILGHATGRLINFRRPYDIDIERIFMAAKERNCLIELNAQPSRLDVKDIYCQLGKLIGIKFAISSDAHSTFELDYLSFGINQARRGWLAAEDVINTRSLQELKQILRR